MDFLQVKLIKPKRHIRDLLDQWSGFGVGIVALLSMLLYATVTKKLYIQASFIFCVGAFLFYLYKLKRYEEMGLLKLTENEIIVDQNEYKINELIKISFKHNHYENYRLNVGTKGYSIYSGFASLMIHDKTNKKNTVHFLLQDEAQYKKMELIIKNWKANGLVIWT